MKTTQRDKKELTILYCSNRLTLEEHFIHFVDERGEIANIHFLRRWRGGGLNEEDKKKLFAKKNKICSIIIQKQ